MDSGGKEQNYWPGFVDALANVVLTLVFVLVIFVFALAISSNKVEQKLQEITAKQQVGKDSNPKAVLAAQQEAAQLRTQLTAAKEKLEALQEQLKKMEEQAAKQPALPQQTAATEETKAPDQSKEAQETERVVMVSEAEKQEVKNQSLKISNKNSSLLSIDFPQNAMVIDAAAARQMQDMFKNLQGRLENRRLLVRSYLGDEVYSVAQRLAYYRAIGVRNQLLASGLVAPDGVSMAIVAQKTPGPGRVEVLLQSKAK